MVNFLVLYEKFGNLTLFKDQQLRDFTKFLKLRLDNIITDFKYNCIIDTDQQNLGRFLSFLSVPFLTFERIAHLYYLAIS